MKSNLIRLALLAATMLSCAATLQAAVGKPQKLTMVPPITSTSSATPSLKTVFKDFFLIGAALNKSQFTEQDATITALIQKQFNQITAENDMKWVRIHPRAGADGYNFGPADTFVKFGEKNGLQLVGHTLVWHNQTPDWVFSGTNPPPESANPSAKIEPGYLRPVYAGPRASRAELLERMRDHIHTVVSRYKGKVKVWDVVNEAVADGDPTNILRNTLWLQIIGPDYIAKAFQYAHEADPDAILRYNDFALEDPVKAQKLVTLIRSLQEQNVPIHAIGTQTHLNVSMASYERMNRSLAEIAKLGLPIHITELDINNAVTGQTNTGANIATNAAAAQADLMAEANQQLTWAYEAVFRAIIKHRDSVKLVTFWGVTDGDSWLNNWPVPGSVNYPLLFDRATQPKPAFDAVIRVAKESPTALHDLTPLRAVEKPVVD